MRARSTSRPMSAYRLARNDNLGPSSRLGGPTLNLEPPSLPSALNVMPSRVSCKTSGFLDLVDGVGVEVIATTEEELPSHVVVNNADKNAKNAADIDGVVTKALEPSKEDIHHPMANQSSVPKKRLHNAGVSPSPSEGSFSRTDNVVKDGTQGTNDTLDSDREHMRDAPKDLRTKDDANEDMYDDDNSMVDEDENEPEYQYMPSPKYVAGHEEGGSSCDPSAAVSSKITNSRTKIHIKIPALSRVVTHQDSTDEKCLQDSEGGRGIKGTDAEDINEEKDKPIGPRQGSSATALNTHIDAIQHPLRAEPVHINAIRDFNGPTCKDVGLTVSHTVGMGTASTSSSLGSPSLSLEATQAATLAAINAVRDGLNKASLHLNLSAGNLSIGLDPDINPGLMISIKLGVPAVTPDSAEGRGKSGVRYPIRPTNINFDTLASSIPQSLRVVSPIEMDVGGLVIEVPNDNSMNRERVIISEPTNATRTFIVLASLTISKVKMSSNSDKVQEECTPEAPEVEPKRSLRVQAQIDALVHQNNLLARDREVLLRESEELRFRLLRASRVAAAALPQATNTLGALHTSLTTLPATEACGVAGSDQAGGGVGAASRIRAAGIQGIKVVGANPEELGDKISVPDSAIPTSAPVAAVPIAFQPKALLWAAHEGTNQRASTSAVLQKIPEERHRMLRELEAAEAALWNRLPREVRNESPSAEEKEEDINAKKRRKRDIQMKDEARGSPSMAASIDDEADLCGVKTLAKLSETFAKIQSTKNNEKPSQPKTNDQLMLASVKTNTATRTDSSNKPQTPLQPKTHHEVMAGEKEAKTNSSRSKATKKVSKKVPKKLKIKRKSKESLKKQNRQYIQHEYHDYSTVKEPPDGCAVLLPKEKPNKAIPRTLTTTFSTFFPVKLHQLLTKAEAEGNSHIIGWQEHGRCFIVRQQKEFVDKIMPRHFQLTKYCSFLRQLNLYGYRRISVGRDKGAYYHELFLRGRPWLASSMVRHRVNGNVVRLSGNPEMEPNFYSMPFLDV